MHFKINYCDLLPYRIRFHYRNTLTLRRLKIGYFFFLFNKTHCIVYRVLLDISVIHEIKELKDF